MSRQIALKCFSLWPCLARKLSGLLISRSICPLRGHITGSFIRDGGITPKFTTEPKYSSNPDTQGLFLWEGDPLGLSTLELWIRGCLGSQGLTSEMPP